nr:hypothetical protein [uncultured Flavobacterium sp.]
MSKPHIIILGCNFAGLTIARYIHTVVNDKAVKYHIRNFAMSEIIGDHTFL